MTQVIAGHPGGRQGNDPLATPVADKVAPPSPSPDGCQHLAPDGSALTVTPISDLVVTRLATSPADVEGLDAHETRLAQAAQQSSKVLPAADTVAAVEAGMLADAADLAATRRATGAAPDDEQHSTAARPSGRGIAVAAAVGQAAVAVQRAGLPPTMAAAVDWSEFGQVIPVLSGSPGAGASVLCAVISDVLQLAAQCVLVVDTADPVRSGLAQAVKSDGPGGPGPHSAVRIRFAWRAQALFARTETSLPVLTPGMVPPPRFWRPMVRELDTTVVDIGHDAWRVSSHPLIGAGEWLRRGAPAPRPVLVVRPTRPSLTHAEQVLARWEPWAQIEAVTPPAQLLVMGAKRWPAGVAGVAGRRLAGLVDGAVFVPHDPGLAVGGITAELTPARARRAVAPLLHSWGLVPAMKGKTWRSWWGHW